MTFVNPLRIHPLNTIPISNGPIVYWMSRDQRVADNWALLYAQRLALERRVPLAVVFALVEDFLGATLRQYGFMLRGLAQVASRLESLNIPFFLLSGDPPEQVQNFILRQRIGAVVCDFDPLRIKRTWRETAARRCGVAMYEVDSHNVVPCRVASSKQEFGAYTLRPRLRRLLPDLLDEFPRMQRHPFDGGAPFDRLEVQSLLANMHLDRAVGEVAPETGESAAHQRLQLFIEQGLERYDLLRNDPNAEGQSGLSPYLHFGQIAPQRVALEVGRAAAGSVSGDAFLEELVVRRELSDNFCWYNAAYDRVEGFSEWARKTHDRHRHDRREFIYSHDRFERAETHDQLWNAAQREMVLTGRMHGYLRMYWAKKILEWSASPEEALEIAIRLNDRYQLDGRDPNGYAGIAWSIGGVHDRAWGERPVFGKIRYMNDKGCKRKFDVEAYIGKWR